MAKGSDLDRVTAIVLREIRPPLIVLIGVYSLGIGVMLVIPGTNGEPMGIFHAFYFMTYTATTTGFGELPVEFSDAQRLWATVCLYMSVVAWIYAIGTIISKVQNPHFTRAIAQARFARNVRRIHDPFVIICGFGDTGSLLARGLSDRRRTAVIIDTDVERIKALSMRDYKVTMPGLEGDASVPKVLQDAGLTRPNCKGIVLLTGDEAVNLKIAVMTRLLNPKLQIVCRSVDRAHEAELQGLGSVDIIDPFATWARELGLALYQPALHTLDEWLVGAHGVTLENLVSHPRGRWILCGFGQMGQTLYRMLEKWGVDMVVIDPNIEAADHVSNGIAGLATRANLEAAGIAEAAGVVAATNRDTDNLAILLAARTLNQDSHLIVRQNHHENELAFSAASADLIMQPSLVTARRILLQLISPIIQAWLDHLEAHPDMLENDVFPRLRANVGDINPALWTVRIGPDEAYAVSEHLKHSSVTVADLLRDPRNRNQSLPCVALALQRGDNISMLPSDKDAIVDGDEVLFCSRSGAEQQIRANLANVYTFGYLADGTVPTRSALLSKLFPRSST